MPPILVPFVKYFDFQGRATRTEYWLFVGMQFGLNIVLAVLAQGHGPNLLGSLWSLATFLPSIAVGVRRYHDINRTGWWYVFPLAVLIIGFFVALSMNADSLRDLAALKDGGASYGSPAVLNALLRMGAGFALAFGLYGLSLLVPLIMHLQPGTPGANRFGPSPDGSGGAERIASVFEAPDAEPDFAQAPEPYKPVFDFGPTPAGRTSPPAAARGLPDVPVARPASQASRPMSSPASGPRPFGRRGL